MHLLTLIVGIVLLPKAYTLACYHCVPGSSGTCTDTVTECPLPQQQCGALRITSYAGGSKLADINSKGCTLPEDCVDASVNFGIAQSIITSSCCSSPLCNSQPAPVPIKSNPNGTLCFQCNGQTCTSTLSCAGNEDYCISSMVTVDGEKVPVKGCSSKLMCSAQSTQLLGVAGAGISCCQGNLCNSAISTSAGILLLVAPLFSSVVLS